MTVDTARAIAYAKANGLDPARVIAQAEALDSQVRVEDAQYYSRIRLAGKVTASESSTLVEFAKGEIQAFGYQIGGDVPILGGGDPLPRKALEIDTNIASAGCTNGGEVFDIKGISFRLGAMTDAKLWEALAASLTLAFELDTKPVLKLGPACDVPALSAVPTGHTWQFAQTPDRVQDDRPLWSPCESRALMYGGRAMPLTKGVRWGKKGESDSTLGVLVKLHEALSFTVSKRSEDTGVSAFDPPTLSGQPGTYVDVWIRLHGGITAKRGTNV